VAAVAEERRGQATRGVKREERSRH
jgi:hypothetical protein